VEEAHLLILYSKRGSASGRFEKLGRLNWVSPLEKFPGHGGVNPKFSDFAATIINQFAEADAQNAITRGS
jgi:hypothetical protein